MKIENDPQPAHQRHTDALIEIVARGVSSPGCAPTTDKAKSVVTVDVLREQTSFHFTRTTATTGPTGRRGSGSFGRSSGTSATGDVLTPATVRRMACDAAIIPVVLGSDSQPLDIGRQERLVTRPMRTMLWLRDMGCSFPGCSMPPAWTDAHHVTHWSDGGETAASNLALVVPKTPRVRPRQSPHRDHHRHRRHRGHLATPANPNRTTVGRTSGVSSGRAVHEPSAGDGPDGERIPG